MDERSLFLAALDKTDPVERAAFLNEACPDPAVRSQVEALLHAHEQVQSFLEQPVVTGAFTPEPGANSSAPPPLAESPGTRIGPYKLLQRIGEGGMGTVWMAEQQEPVRRTVALKVVKAGMDSAQVVARFEAERQALALMDHPHIAKVHDAGTTEHGRPYFVMELVKGTPITKYCDEHRLTPRQRLALFVPVCQALQHAHQKGIIHRDVKPSNVMVAPYDGRPVVKVIDFGVAKAAGQRLTDRTLFTEVGAVVGTLEYMSPEQAELNNQDIDTRSDVYSLGVLLYELLTGTTPLTRKRLRQAAFDEMLRLIREEEPPKPSTRLSESQEALPSISAQRQTEPAKLTRLVRGELDWIVMRALEKDRSRRYETANGFARDIERYLADEPVEACPPSAGYRLRKFLRRNKGPVLAATLVLLALLGGIAGTTWGLVRTNRAWAAEAEQRAAADRHRDEADEQRRRAETEAAIARAVNDFLNKDLLALAGPFRQPDRDIKLRTVLDRASGRIAGRFPNQPLVEAAIHQTIGNAYDELGEYASAQTHLERGLALYRRERGDEHPETLTAMVSLGYVFLDRGQYEQAKPLFDQALAIRRRQLGEEHPDTLAVMDKIAQWHFYQGQSSLAEPIQAQVLETSRRVLGEEHLDTVDAYHRLGMTNIYLERYARAEQLLVQARQLAERTLGPDHLFAIRAGAMLGEAYKRWGKLDQAEPLLTKGVQDAERVLGAHHRDTCYTLMNLAGLYTRQNKLKEAEEVLVKALDGIVRSIGYEHDQTQTVVRMLVETYMRQQKFDRAEQVLILALEAVGRQYGSDDVRNLYYLARLAFFYRNRRQLDKAEPMLARGLNIGLRVSAEVPNEIHVGQVGNFVELFRVLGRYPEAEKLARHFLEIRRRERGEDHPRTLNSMTTLARLYQQQRRYAEAEAMLRRALDVARRAQVNYMPSLLDNLAELYQEQGLFAQAEPLWRELLALRQRVDPESVATAYALADLGQNLLRQGKPAAAEPLLRECLAIREKKLPDDWLTFSTKSMLGEALLAQKKYAEAEPHLAQGYEGLKQREAKIPANSKVRMTEALERLVQLYEATNKPEEAAKWRKELQAITAPPPAGRPPASR